MATTAANFGAVEFPKEEGVVDAAAGAVEGGAKVVSNGVADAKAAGGEITGTVAADAKAMAGKDDLGEALEDALDGKENGAGTAAFAPEKLLTSNGSAGPAPPKNPKAMTNDLCKKYLSSTVTPLISAGLAKLAVDQPADPIEELAKFLELHHPSPKVKPVILAFGVRGSGKEAACQRLMDEFGWVWLQAGDVLRSEVEGSTENAKTIADCMKSGETVPAELTVHLVLQAMEDVGDVPGVILDGFPRKLDQAGLFERNAGKQFRGALYFNVPKDVALERCVAAARPHTRFDPVARFEQRWKTFERHVMPVVEYYKGANKLTTVNAGGNPDDTFAELRHLFAPIFKVPAKKQ
eukprot:CAMPEP_0185844334 /NCGR_PEP_ID=MMETSP1354-20130828/533_1 /TAXON_ID=708628 /ORGANISM="Erythrolobus madagascarensis, Strain CCMP3276" /LENGTH=350 /DNA_ID=CAMNT_0028543981 /DNA_START=47 /DNA_END=1099 /DNA_ORIENTATION=+